MPVLTRKQIARLHEVAYRWSSEISDNRWKVTEGGIHELAHAAAFGFRFDASRATYRISRRFDELPPILGLTEEARAFAVQRLVLRRLGIRRHVPMAPIVRDVWENGISGPALPFRVFALMIRRFERDVSVKHAAGNVVDYLLRQIGKG